MEPEQLKQLNETGGGSPIAIIVALAITIFVIAGVWKVFSKAGEPGWAVLIPIYNLIVFLKVAGKPLWWIILLFVPIANFVVAILASLGLAERFGKGGGFGIGLAFLPFIFFPILGFGSATYIGPKTP
jgi:hypothetical protein